jgi:magnesium chelatase family protein
MVHERASASTAAVIGVEGHVVEVETELGDGPASFLMAGISPSGVWETRDRIRAAILNAGWVWPDRPVTVGLFPAALPKSGAGFDVAIAAAVLAASGAVPPDACAGRLLLGELALDGSLRPVRGVLPAVLAAARVGIGRVVVAPGNAAEAGLVPKMIVEPVADLRSLVAVLRGGHQPGGTVSTGPPAGSPAPPDPPDLADLAAWPGGTLARRAVEVAAAGGHHLFLRGPAGSGATMLAQRLPGVLPPLIPAEALEVAAVHAAAGVLPAGAGLVSRAPYRAPHHTVAAVTFAGGGGGAAAVRPGILSEAHRGVLFLDDVAAFPRRILELLRTPLDAGVVEVTRAATTVRLPAWFLLVLAAPVCPCTRGAHDPATDRPDPDDHPTFPAADAEDTDRSGAQAGCICSPGMRARYRARLSGPLFDRIDLTVRLAAPDLTGPRARQAGESTAVVAARVAQARAAATARLAATPWRVNREVPDGELRRRWPLPATVTRQVDLALHDGHLTAHGHATVLRVAWTLADLAGLHQPGPDQIGQALGLRRPGRPA